MSGQSCHVRLVGAAADFGAGVVTLKGVSMLPQRGFNSHFTAVVVAMRHDALSLRLSWLCATTPSAPNADSAGQQQN
jgi:hypothetical protein